MNNGLTLGEFIAELEKLPSEANIDIDFGGAVPTTLDSYRGYYDHLALGYDGEYGAKLPTVDDILKDAKNALGKTFTGWKGGDFKMHDQTSIWIANPGNTSDTYIKGIKRRFDNWFIIETETEIGDD